MEKKPDLKNQEIEAAVAAFYDGSSQETLMQLLLAIQQRAMNGGRFLLPVEVPASAFGDLDPSKLKAGSILQTKEDIRFSPLTLQLPDGRNLLPAFTSNEELEKGQAASSLAVPIQDYLSSLVSEKYAESGVINPWGKSFLIPKDMAQAILDECKKNYPPSHIYVEQGDITKLEVECIVNAANHSLLGGGGVDGAIHRAAGPGLLAECRTLGGCKTGEAKITKGYNLKARYVIHTVGPVYSGAPQDAEQLASCYRSSLELAKQHGIHTIAFPAISTGVYGYPRTKAIPIALKTVARWLDDNPTYSMGVVMSCFDRKTYDMFQEFIQAAGRQQ